MTHTHLVLHVPFNLEDQKSILNQLYQLSFDTAMDWEELEITWDVLSQEELTHVIV